jgi:hypothetical protein
MDDKVLQEHIDAINFCNQRAGRMLSLVDLIKAGTMDLPLAAYLAAAMRSGVSLLVGARPGAAGKTTVMCALLNFLPDRTAIRPVDSRAVLAAARHDAEPARVCYLAHEISPASYYAYIWGDEARAFFALTGGGYSVACNLHADTLEETRSQLCRESGVAPAHLDAVNLKVYLEVQRTGGWNMRRWVGAVYESDGTQDRLSWIRDAGGAFARQYRKSMLTTDSQEEQYAQFLAALLREDKCRIETVRRALIDEELN